MELLKEFFSDPVLFFFIYWLGSCSGYLHILCDLFHP